MRSVFLDGQDSRHIDQGNAWIVLQPVPQEVKIKPLPAEESIIGKLRDSITENTETWADMEMGLGRFTAEMGGIDDLDNTYRFLRDNLRDYLKEEQAKLKAVRKSVTANRKLLTQPGVGLPPESIDAINNYVDSYTRNNKTLDINIISFNYTDVVERAFGYEGAEINLEKTDTGISRHSWHCQ